MGWYRRIIFKIRGSDVYYNDEHIPHIKSTNFIRISDHVGKDNKKVYWGAEVIKGADAKTFEFLARDHFYRDKKRVFYLGQRIPDADPDTFKVFHCARGMTQFGYYAKDAANAYYIHTFRIIRVKKIYTRDLEGFWGLDDQYAVDNVYVYGRGVKRENSDPDNLQELGHGYWGDKNNIYYDGKILAGADPETFRVIGGNMYATDRYNLFWNGQLWNNFKDNITAKEIKEFIKQNKQLKGYWWKLKDLGRQREYGASFEGQEGYFIQDNNVFWEGILLQYADYKTFQILNHFYAKDKNHGYYTDRRLVKSDVKSFKVIEDELRSSDYNHGLYAKDKAHFYYKGAIDKKINARTYKVLNRYYSKDIKNVYHLMNHIIRNADPKTFEIIEGKHAADETREYFEGVQTQNVSEK